MSDLQRSFAKTQLARLPPEVSPTFDENEEIEDNAEDIPPTSPNDSSSSASSVDSTDTIIPSARRNLFERPRGYVLHIIYLFLMLMKLLYRSATRSRAGPLSYSDFFAQELYFGNPSSPGLRHHAYLTPPGANGPLIVTHHGAGSSGLSFATFFQSLTTLLPNAGILSLDCRGHGLTTCPSPIDLTLPTLASDLAFVVKATTTKLSWPTLPPIILLGHSLGGAVVTEVAHTSLLGSSLLGYGVLDVVEGSAMDALQSMESYLSTRPRSFPSINSAIEWHTRSRTIRNTTSARVSVPALITPCDPQTTPESFVWRTDLSATKPFWENWFVGLSSKFLNSRSGKLLILAGTDRLDKELMIGQMQGKYQLQVFPDAGHFVHEDQPLKTATVVADFFRRNDRSALVLPPKVDELIKKGVVKGGGH
jgi:protein phosphatase methylesterase 1